MKDYSTYTDEELIPLLREAKPVCEYAFYIIYRRYAAKVNAFCILRTSNRSLAEEIFQEVWSRFIHKVKSGAKITNTSAYLLTIARHLVIDNLKRSGDNRFISIDSIEFDTPDPVQTVSGKMESEELISLIRIAVNTLDDIYKDAFILRKFDCLSYKDIADMSGETEECIRKRTQRATEMIRQILKPYIDEIVKN